MYQLIIFLLFVLQARMYMVKQLRATEAAVKASKASMTEVGT